MRPRGLIACLLFTFVLTGCDPHPVLIGPQPTPSASPSGAVTDPEPGDEPDPSQEPGAAQPGLMPVVINHGPRNVNAVALTFDADMTAAMLANLDSGKVRSYANIKVLDILDQREVPATFFLTGMWAERYAEVAARIAHEDRYEIANHTYRHSAYVPNCHGLPMLARSEMTRDPKRTFEVLARFRGHQTRYFRFPGLCHDPAALKALAPLGVTVIDGDCASGDPFAKAAAPIVRRVLNTVQPGSIIILHLTEANAPYTDQALGPILDGLAARGLRPVKLSELLAGQPR